MTSDTSEKGLETLIVASLTGRESVTAAQSGAVHYTAPGYGSGGYTEGDARDYDRDHAVDLIKLFSFLEETQPKAVEQLAIREDGPKRQQFLARLQGEVTKRGVVDVLRHGIKHGPVHLDLFYGTPTPGNAKAEERYSQNRFSITRQLRYSRDETQLALDAALFINGLPVATFELKNSLTKQTVEDAVQQYKRDRDPRELLFQFGRCVAHFAVDDHEVRFCTHLKGKGSWFLPFNQGWNDGAGNPLNPEGLKTDYLWKRILTRRGLTDILENYAQIVERKDPKTGKKKRDQIFPRYLYQSLWDAAGVTRTGNHRVKFEVTKRWKGARARSVVVVTRLTGEACGFPFEEKKEYLVYVAPGPSNIETGICTGTKSIVGAEPEIEKLDRLARSSEVKP